MTIVENPFINDDRLYKMRNAGVNYCVVSPESSTQLDFIGFRDRRRAFDEAVSTSKCSLWAFIIELTDFHVVAYLTGYCSDN